MSTTPPTLIRLQARTRWPEGGFTLCLERKKPNQRSYELIHVVQSQAHLLDVDARDFLEALEALVAELLGSCGYGAEFLDLWEAEPF